MNVWNQLGSGLTKSIRLYPLWVLILLFVVSCGNSSPTQGAIRQVTPMPSGTPPVEYGASLSEWEEGVHSGAQQAAVGTEIEDTASTAAADGFGIPFTYEDVVYQEMSWDGLVPADFTSEAISAQFEERMADVEDGSEEAMALYQEMKEAFSQAPVNEVLDETLIRLPGFIAPLNYSGELITEFLLVPYFGACIHVPPPPVNQTVLVKAADGEGIRAEDAYNPIWVMGRLTTEGASTTLAAAGYNIQDAVIEPYATQR